MEEMITQTNDGTLRRFRATVAGSACEDIAAPDAIEALRLAAERFGLDGFGWYRSAASVIRGCFGGVSIKIEEVAR